jgi:uncharacterized protein with von Willebrand factor type A (vWA) domain
MNATALASEKGNETIGWEAGRWERLLHDRRAADEGQALLDAEVGIAGAVAKAAIATGAFEEGCEEELLDGAAGAAAHLGRGVFSLLYGQPERSSGGPAWARAAVEAIASVPGIEEAARACAGDPDIAAIGAAALLREVQERAPEWVRKLTEEGCDPTGEGEGDGAEAIGQAAGRQLRGAIVKAIREAAEARAELDGLLPGLGGTPAAHEQEQTGRLDLLARIRSDERLRRVLAIAGRIRRIAERVQRTRCDDAREEVVDLERGADLGRVLPSELMGLRAGKGSALRRLVLKGIADRSLNQYRLTGTEPLGKGPIVAMLDASDSMDARLADGLERIEWAAAIGIAVVRAAVEQHRHAAICVFSGRVGQTWRLDGRDREAAKTAVFDLARLRPRGGTNFDAPISWALDSGAEQDRADLILVTDGAGMISEPLIARLAASRKRGLRCWGILAGDGAIPDTLAAFCDGIAEVNTGTEDVGAKIGGLGAT